jgi:short-subunit dehydrogenase
MVWLRSMRSAFRARRFGKFALPLGRSYHASKFALEGYSDALRNEVRQFGIDMIIMEPGGIALQWADIAGGGICRIACSITW